MDRLRGAPVALVLCLVATGCTSHGRKPERLFGGARPARLPAALRDVGQLLVTRVRVTSAEALGRRFETCARLASVSFPDSTTVVERTTALGQSTTFEDDTGKWVYGCFASGGPPDGARRWCGLAAGRRSAGRLTDPRLDVLCKTESGVPVASVWVEPLRHARWVALDQGGYTEVYETAGRLPIRVLTTHDVHVSGARAAFELAQYDARGRLLIRTRLEARVAG